MELRESSRPWRRSPAFRADDRDRPDRSVRPRPRTRSTRSERAPSLVADRIRGWALLGHDPRSVSSPPGTGRPRADRPRASRFQDEAAGGWGRARMGSARPRRRTARRRRMKHVVDRRTFLRGAVAGGAVAVAGGVGLRALLRPPPPWDE